MLKRKPFHFAGMNSPNVTWTKNETLSIFYVANRLNKSLKPLLGRHVPIFSHRIVIAATLNTCQSPYCKEDRVGSITNSHLPFRFTPLVEPARRSFLPRGAAEKFSLVPSSSPTLRVSHHRHTTRHSPHIPSVNVHSCPFPATDPNLSLFSCFAYPAALFIFKIEIFHDGVEGLSAIAS